MNDQSKTIRTRLTQVSTRARRLLILQGLAALVAVTFSSAFLLGMGDYWIRTDDIGVRVLAFTMWVMAIVAAAGRFVFQPLRNPISHLTTAQWIERQNPGFTSLSSAIAFIDTDPADSTDQQGSPQLRQEVIRDASRKLQDIETGSCIRVGPTRKTVLQATLICVAIVAICLLDIKSSLHAARRLASPLSEQPWPRWNSLRFVRSQSLVARGHDVQFLVSDLNGRMPDSVFLEMRPNSLAKTKRVKMSRHNSDMQHILSNATLSFQFRAVGGDDETEWFELTVVERTRVVELTMTLTPPAYSRLPARKTKNRLVNALPGTRIELHGKVNRRLNSAQLKISDTSVTIDVPLTLLSDGSEFATRNEAAMTWTVEQSSSFSFALIDQERVLSESDRWQIRITEDARPTVTIGHEEEELVVTPDVRLPIPVVVKDDIGIDSVTSHLEFDPSQAPLTGQILPAGQRQHNVQSWTHQWLLESRRPVEFRPGTTVRVWFMAADRKRQMGRSSTVRLKVVSLQAFRDLMSQRRAAIVAKLREAMTLQKSSLEKVAKLKVNVGGGVAIEPAQLDQVRRAQLSQRQVQTALSGSDQSARQLATRLSRDLSHNQLQTPTESQQLARLIRRLTEIGGRDVSAALLHLAQSAKSLQGEQGRNVSPASVRSIQRALDASEIAQARIIKQLNQLLNQFARWDTYQRFAREFHRVREEQSALARQTASIQGKTIGRQADDLSEELKGELERLAGSQRQLSIRFTTLIDRMRQPKGPSQDSLTQSSIDEALRLIDQLRIAPLMDRAAQAIRDNQVGSARRLQQQIDQRLARVLAALTDKDQKNLQRTIPSLNREADKLGQLIAQHKGIRNQLNQAKNAKGSAQQAGLQKVTKSQAELNQELTKLAKALDQLGANQPANLVRDANEQIRRSTSAIGNKQIDLANRLMEGSGSFLNQALRQLGDQIDEVKNELEMALRRRFEQLVRQILARQIATWQATKTWQQAAPSAGGQLSLRNRRKILAIAAEQKAVAELAEQTSKQLPKATAFTLYLGKTVAQMQMASQRLSRFRAAAVTQNHQQSAIEFLRIIAVSSGIDTTNRPPQTSIKQKRSTKRRTSEFHVAGQLKLLSLMQQQLIQRTEKLDKIRTKAGTTKAVQQQANQLALDQLELITITRELQKRLRNQPAARQAQ